VRGLRTALLAASALLVEADTASAQFYVDDAPRRWSVEVSGGGLWAQGYDLESVRAELSRATGSEGFELFSADGRSKGFPGAHARVGLYLTRALSVEGGVRFARPELAYELSGDAESAEDERAVEVLSHYVFEGSVLLHFVNSTFAGGRAVPFVSAGGGHLRELHEGSQLVETGTEIHGTAGLKYWFGSGRRRLGLRMEAGVSSRTGGADGVDSRRTVPIVLGGAGFLF
jgi:hypothetical protein